MSRHTREKETGKEKGGASLARGGGKKICVCVYAYVCVCARFPVLLSAFCFQLWLPSSPKLKCLNTLPFSPGPSKGSRNRNKGRGREVKGSEGEEGLCYCYGSQPGGGGGVPAHISQVRHNA